MSKRLPPSLRPDHVSRYAISKRNNRNHNARPETLAAEPSPEPTRAEKDRLRSIRPAAIDRLW